MGGDAEATARTSTSCLKRQTRTRESARPGALGRGSLSPRSTEALQVTVTELTVSTQPSTRSRQEETSDLLLTTYRAVRLLERPSSATRPASHRRCPGWRRQDRAPRRLHSPGLGPSAISLLCVNYFYFVTQLNLFSGKKIETWNCYKCWAEGKD